MLLNIISSRSGLLNESLKDDLLAPLLLPLASSDRLRRFLLWEWLPLFRFMSSCESFRVLGPGATSFCSLANYLMKPSKPSPNDYASRVLGIMRPLDRYESSFSRPSLKSFCYFMTPATWPLIGDMERAALFDIMAESVERCLGLPKISISSSGSPPSCPCS